MLCSLIKVDTSNELFILIIRLYLSGVWIGVVLRANTKKDWTKCSDISDHLTSAKNIFFGLKE